MTYAKHYAPRAKTDMMFHPPTPYTRTDFRAAPVCRTRGSLDVTPDREKVTCRSCTTHIAQLKK